MAQGVVGVNPEETGELDRAKEFFARQTSLHPAGSPDYTRALVAQMGLEQLIDRRSGGHLDVVVPTTQELRMAIRLTDPEHRSWRQALGMRARRLDAGEAVSIAIAVARRKAFGCDDADARIAYGALGGIECLSTLDLVRRAVTGGLISEGAAREGYERLRSDYRFFGPPWR